MAMKQQRVLSRGAVCNGRYLPQRPTDIPVALQKYARKARNTEVMWEQLSDLHTPISKMMMRIYFNRGDGKWWLDAPDGNPDYI